MTWLNFWIQELQNAALSVGNERTRILIYHGSLYRCEEINNAIRELLRLEGRLSPGIIAC